MQTVTAQNAPAAIGPYAQAVKSNGFIFCSGQIPLIPETGELLCSDISKETAQVMENLSAVLLAAGSSFDKVVKTTIYLTDLNDFPAVNEMYGSFFGEQKPARTTVAVAALPKGARVEIDAIACF